MPKQLTPKPQEALRKVIEKEVETEIRLISTEEGMVENVTEAPLEPSNEKPGRTRHKSRSLKK